jgi:hypothetical protein
MKLKRKTSNYTKGLKKIKRIRIKIEKQNYFFIWLKGVIEKKNQFSKRTDKSKEWGSKLT